jgi:Family of unknown function (DUF6152)
MLTTMRQILIVGLALLAAAAVSHAHHSGAMFDGARSITLSGTVKAFQWTNPHCWIQLLVPAPDGVTEWSIEMGSPTQLYRSGWRPRTLAPGQKVTILIHPTRDGSRGGQFVSRSDS